ncbi:uroplakin-3b-like [Ahaetulla prasina]|uniref:uroplakin-3b-like n=1 Tax=Ahaetulla prasina TaxID=499056 RepID=UPI002648EAAB|nr:uroplakin-3b-like [Ahaetulla prasina]
MTASLLLLFLIACETTALEVVPYTPRVSDFNMAGKITASTFALESPRCVFDSFINASDNIWLVITFANATTHFKNPTSTQQIPPYEELYTAYAFMTMKSTLSQYPCTKGKTTNVLRVGNESSCKNDDTRTHCNGPLPSTGPYSLAWSAAETWKTIDTWPGRRSGDMIVITVILSTLCGVITIGFLSTVCYECFKRWRHDPSENQEEQRPEPFQGSRYDTHHIPPAPAVPPPPPPSADMPSPHLTPS